MYIVKLSTVLMLLLALTSCSDNKTSNSSGSTGTGGYQGGETVDGYTLPPKPPKTQNDATLLGIDTNNNSIRDDVEIYIYNRFQGYTNSKVEREIAMQWAKTAQQLIQSPESAYEDKKHKISERTLSCQWYYYGAYLKNVSYEEGLKYRIEHDIFNAEFKDAVFNTKERLKAYFRYNKSMSGHVFSDDYFNAKEDCDFDPDPLIEGTL
jgi:hypothetical protein